jgi:hypothetical protein
MTPRDRVYQQNLARLRMQGADSMALDAAGVQTGGVFLESELSKLDPIIRMPLENYTHQRDIPITYGGGWAEQEIARNVDFAGPSESESGTDSNDNSVISYSANQDVWPIYTYQKRIRIPVVESLRMAQTNRSPQDLLDKGVRLDWNKLLDRRTYIGRKIGNTVVNPGLIGNPNVTSTQLPTTGTGTSALWANKTPQQIFEDFNFMAKTIWAASGYAPAGVPTRFLVPSDNYDQLLQPMTLGSVAVADSILDWIEKRSYGVKLGAIPQIFPLPGPWIDGTGIGGTNQIVAYKFDQDCLSLNIAQDLTRFGGPLSVQAGAFETTYLGNVGIVKINRFQTIGYFYGQS